MKQQTLVQYMFKYTLCQISLPPLFDGVINLVWPIDRYTTKSSTTCFVSTLKGTPNLYFLSELLAISTGRHGVHEIQLDLLSKYLEGHTKSVLLIRATCYQYWLTDLARA